MDLVGDDTEHFVTKGVCRHSRAGIDVVCGSYIHRKVVPWGNKELLGSNLLQSGMFRSWGSKDPPGAQLPPDVKKVWWSTPIGHHEKLMWAATYLCFFQLPALRGGGNAFREGI